jgi:hypothetical protein
MKGFYQTAYAIQVHQFWVESECGKDPNRSAVTGLINKFLVIVVVSSNNSSSNKTIDTVITVVK